MEHLAHQRSHTEDLRAKEPISTREVSLLKGQNRVLELLATGASTERVLTALIEVIEDLQPGVIGSILVLDQERNHLRHSAAPRLPQDYIRQIDGIEIGPKAGSCGSAAYRVKTVIVEDIEIDPL